MLSEDRVKLAVVPVLASLRKVVAALRSLPLPRPLQRLSERGLARLARIPELAQLLGLKPEAKLESVGPNGRPLAEQVALLNSADYRTRLKAVQALVHYRERAVVDALLLALRDKSVEVAIAAVSSLHIAAGDAARAPLREVLDNVQGYYHPLVRAAALHALGSLLTPEESESIASALRDRDAEVSIAAISALAASTPERAGALFLQVIENQDGFFLPITRLAAARGLERLPYAPDAARVARQAALETDPQLAQILNRMARLP
jgi:HEAT repeat protein